MDRFPIETGNAGEPVYVRLNKHILDDVQLARVHLQTMTPATVTRADAIRHLIMRGAAGAK